MAYIGQGIKNGTFTVLDTSGNTYNGSNVTFSLGTQVGSAAQLLVSHDGVIQKPGTDYTLATGGTQITFSTAPASGASIFIVEISGAVGGPMNRDLDGDELVLDTDGDTSITADTDDQIDIKVAGTDQITIKDGALSPVTDNDIDLGTSSLEFKDAFFDGTVTTDGLTVSGTPSFADGSIAIADLDIDGGTDIGADIADADLFIIDDGGGGTNRKVAASRIATYVGGTFVKTGSVDFESGTGADNVFLSDVFSDTYDTYMVILRRILPEDDGDKFRFRFTSTGTSEISGSHYNYSARYFKDDGGSGSRTGTSQSRFEITDEVSNVEDDGGADFTLFITLDRTDNAGNSGSFHGTGHYNNASTSSHATVVSGVLQTATSSKKPGGLQFLFASGQIRKIHAIVYGIKE